MRLSIKALLTLSMISLAASAHAAQPEPVVLHTASDVAEIDKNVSWFVDPSGHLSIDDILNPETLRRFTPYSTHPLPFAHSSRPFWLQVEVENQSPLEEWYLAAFSSMYEDIQVYEITPTPEGLTWKQKELLSGRRHGTVTIEVAQGSTKLFFIKFTTYDPPTALFIIQSENTLAARDAKELPFYGTLVGIFLALILYNLFLCFSLRRRIHFYYVLFAACNSYIALLSINIPIGIFGHFSLTEWGHLLRFIAPLSTTLFTQVFFKSKKLFPRTHLCMQATLAIYAALLLYQTISGDSRPLEYTVEFLMLGTIVFISSIAMLSYRAGNSSAKYFMMAIGVFFVGVIIQTYYTAVGLSADFYLHSGHVIGQAAEMILMSLALASQIKTLEEEKVRAEATSIAKSKLLRVMSHDIMNPLALIKGFVHVMQRRPSESQHLEKIVRSATMIENIVQFVVRYETSRGGKPFRLEPVSVKAIFEELAFLFRQVSMDKGIKISFELPADDLHVLAEKISLTNEIMANLISNALKFSFVGSTIKVRAIQHPESVTITVKDNGVGIPKPLLGEIFNPSLNISRQGTKGELGSGFGMPIVWSFVKELGGTINIQSISFDDDKSQCGTLISLTLKKAKGPLGNVETAELFTQTQK